jgi:hypothetical protein
MSVKPAEQRLMAEGPPAERNLLARERAQQVEKFVREVTRDMYPQLRSLLAECRAGRVDHEVFKEVVRRLNAFSLVEEMQNWETYRGKQLK